VEGCFLIFSLWYCLCFELTLKVLFIQRVGFREQFESNERERERERESKGKREKAGEVES
jgi:hypothetical protein